MIKMDRLEKVELSNHNYLNFSNLMTKLTKSNIKNHLAVSISINL